MTATPSSAVQSRRFLIIEDDRSQAALLCHWLKAANHEVEVVESVKEALARLPDGGWDCVISDLMLPDGTGLDVLRELKRHRPDVPTALMTNAGGLDSAIAALREGIDDFILKPVSHNDLMDRVALLCSKIVTPTRVLAIGAHPDDVEIGCGGALLAHAAAGSALHILTLSSGENGGGSDVRKVESEAAAKALGAQIAFGGLPDTEMKANGETIRIIERVIREFRPTVVYTHSHHDTHQDHRAVHHATVVAARAVGNVYCYQSPSTNIDFRPTRFLDIGPQLGAKLELLSVYASQEQRAYLSEDFVRSTAVYWGRYAGYGAVEPFEVIRDTRED